MPVDTKILPLLATLALCLSGCGNGGESGTDGTVGARTPLSDPVTTPEPLLAVEGDPDRIGAVPNVVAVETLADSGLQVAFTDEAQRERIDPRYVGAQWQHMQTCVEIVAPPPLVVVVAGPIEPLIATDDVLRDIEGRITASASAGVDGTAILQVHESDFDGSVGNPGFALRSIMGRHLWLSAMLAERDYPYLCARAPAPGTAPPDTFARQLASVGR